MGGWSVAPLAASVGQRPASVARVNRRVAAAPVINSDDRGLRAMMQCCDRARGSSVRQRIVELRRLIAAETVSFSLLLMTRAALRSAARPYGARNL